MGTSSTQTQQSATNTSPWAPQQGYLQGAFQDASNAYNTAQGNNSSLAPSQFVAQYNPGALSAFQNMVGYGNGNGTAASEAATGGALAGAGTAGATGALSTLGAFNPASTNNTAAVTNAAGAYANNPYISGQVQAAMRDANQEAQDVTLPGIQENAAATGNINSNRTGIAQGIVQRGLAQQAGDISAQLQGNAYNTGIQTAENQLANNNQQAITAAQSAGLIGNSAAGTGIGAQSQSINDQGNLYNLAATGGQGLTAADQAGLSNRLQAWQFGQQSPFSALDQAYGIWGGNNWGGQSSGTQTTTSTPSTMQTIGGILGMTGTGSKLLFGA